MVLSKRNEADLAARFDRIGKKFDRLFELTSKILSAVGSKNNRQSRNANDYQSRKQRKIVMEDERRKVSVQNPDGSPFEVKKTELWKVADAFVKKNQLMLYLLLMNEEENKAEEIIMKLVRFWCGYYWETPIKSYGSQYSVFAGWTSDRDNRLKARRATIVATGDIVFKPGKFTTSRPWDATKATRFGEPKMWRLLYVLVGRMLHGLQFGEDFEEVD